MNRYFWWYVFLFTMASHHWRMFGCLLCPKVVDDDNDDCDHGDFEKMTFKSKSCIHGLHFEVFFPVSNSGHQEAYTFRLGSFKESCLIMYTLKILGSHISYAPSRNYYHKKIRLNGVAPGKKNKLGKPHHFLGSSRELFSGERGPYTQHTFQPAFDEANFPRMSFATRRLMDLVSINSALSALCNGQAVSMALQLLRRLDRSDWMKTFHLSSEVVTL